MSNLLNEFSHLIMMESDVEINEMIANAPDEILGDLLYVATRDLSIVTAKKILARQPDVMKLMTTQGFDKTPTPVHYYLCHNFDYVMYEDEENFDATRCELLNVFLHHGANPNWQRENGDSALESAIRGGNEDLVTLLLDAGAKIDSTRRASALNPAIASINDEQQRLAMLDRLIKAGADINGNTKHRPILLAAGEGQIDTIKFLLASGADLYAENDDGKNLMDIASRSNHSNLIEFCASQNWLPNADQQSLIDYAIAANKFDFSAIVEISKRFPQHCLEQFHIISFSYAATQLKQHEDAINWAERAINLTLNSRAVNRYIAALAYASKFSEVIDCFITYQDRVKLNELDNFAQANLLMAAHQTHNSDLLQNILNQISSCESTGEGAGLLYFNAACVTSSQNRLQEGFKFVVAARLNNFSLDSINKDPDLALLRELPEFSALQNWKNVGNDFYCTYDNGKELWYFRDDLFEIDFAEQSCIQIMTCTGSNIEKAMTLCFAIRDYEQVNKPTGKISAAVNTMCEDITTAIMELLDSENGNIYNGIRFEWDFGEGPLARYWWAAGVPPDEEFDDESAITFETYCWCTEEMYQQLVEQLKVATKPLFMNRQFYIQLGEHDCGEGEAIKLGN